MATLDQLERALVRADAAGDTASARVLAREVRRMRGEPRQQGGGGMVHAATGSFLEGFPVVGPALRGGAERLGAVADTVLDGTTYPDALARRQQTFQQSQEQHPVASALGGIAGAVTGTAPLVAVAPAAFGAGGGGLLARSVASGVSGAALGGSDAAVRSGGEVRPTVIGALAGGGAGAAAPAAGRAIGTGWQRLRDWRAARSAANAAGIDHSVLSRLGRAVRDDGLDPAAIGQRMQELGPDAMLMDLGPNLQRQAGALAATPGRGQEIVRGAIANRQAGAGGRVGGALDDALGQPFDTLALADDIVTRRSAAARPLYQSAYQDGANGVWSPELERMAGSPMVADAMRKAAATGQDRAILDGFGSFNPRVTFTQDGRLVFNQTRPGGSPLYPDLQYWDYVKRNLDDIAGEAARAGRGSQASVARTMASRLRDELDRAVPSYRAAREAYAGPSAVMEAMEEGQAVFRNAVTPAQLRRQIASMGQAERDAFIQGARAQVADIMGTARNDALAARSMFQRGYNRDKLEILLGRDQAQRLTQALDAETAFTRTRDIVTGNSETAARSAAMREIAGDPGGHFGLREGYMAGGILGGVRSAGVRAVEGLARALSSAGQETRNAGLAQILTDPNYRGIAEALARSQGVPVNDESIQAIARALMIGGGTAAARP